MGSTKKESKHGVEKAEEEKEEEVVEEEAEEDEEEEGAEDGKRRGEGKEQMLKSTEMKREREEAVQKVLMRGMAAIMGQVIVAPVIMEEVVVVEKGVFEKVEALIKVKVGVEIAEMVRAKIYACGVVQVASKLFRLR